MTRVRLVLVDERIVREGIRAMLQDSPDVTVIGEADDGAAALEVVCALDPDVALVALRLGTESGVDLCRRLVASHPRTAVIVLSSHSDQHNVIAAWRAGAQGYLLTRASPQELVSAARAVSVGEPVLDPRLGGLLAMRLAAAGETGATANGHPTGGTYAAIGTARLVPGQRSASGHDLDRLSTREREVLAHLSRGETNAEIAQALFISQETVRSHVKAILRKLRAGDRSQAVAIALRSGLVE